jgi:hypothetical protein
MNKRRARPLAELVGTCLADAFARRGFAATEIVTHWEDIAGPEIAAHAEPVKIDWPRLREEADPEPATLHLRVEGPAAIEIQHLAGVIVERVNRFFGWPAIGRIALRQAPLARRRKTKLRREVDPESVRRVADTLTGVADEDLRAALARLGAAIRQG